MTGNFQTEERFTPSWNPPSFDAPSPKEHKTILPVFEKTSKFVVKHYKKLAVL